MKTIQVTTLTEYALSELFPEYEQEHIERCPECGSSLFRIYNEPVPDGTYDQMVCSICNHRYGGWVNRYVSEKEVDKSPPIEKKVSGAPHPYNRKKFFCERCKTYSVVLNLCGESQMNQTPRIVPWCIDCDDYPLVNGIEIIGQEYPELQFKNCI